MDHLARLGLVASTALLALPGVALAKDKPPKHYSIGMASRSVAVSANGTFAGKPVYLGGYGLGNGRVGDSAAGVDNPVKPTDNGLPTYDDGRSTDGNLDGGPSVQATVIS